MNQEEFEATLESGKAFEGESLKGLTVPQDTERFVASRCNLSGVDMSGVKLTVSILDSYVLGCTFAAQATRLFVKNSRLEKNRLSGTFRHTKLDKVILDTCDLTGLSMGTTSHRTVRFLYTTVTNMAQIPVDSLAFVAQYIDEQATEKEHRLFAAALRGGEEARWCWNDYWDLREWFRPELQYWVNDTLMARPELAEALRGTIKSWEESQQRGAKKQ